MQETITKGMVLEILKRVGYCRTKIVCKEHISGVFLTPAADRIRAVATDGHRAAVWNELDNPEEERDSVNVPGQILDYIWMQRDNVKSLVIEAHNGQQYPIRVMLEDTTVLTAKNELDHEEQSVEFKLTPKEFPPYRNVFPAHCDAAITGDTYETRRAINKIKKSAVTEVMLFSDQGHLYLRGHVCDKPDSDIRVPRAKIGALSQPNSYDSRFEAGFNLKHFYECFKSIPQDTYTIKTLGPLDPVIVETDDSKHVIMPMRI